MNNKMIIRNTLLVIFGLLVLCFVAKFYHDWFGTPFKVKDPSSPWFNARHFDLADYPTPEKLNAALVKLFPEKTGRDYVNFVLYSAGGRPNPYMNSTEIVRYDFPASLRYWDKGPFLVATFNESNELLNIQFMGLKIKLYPNNPNAYDIRGR